MNKRPRTKLSKNDVENIRRMVAEGFLIKAVASRYGVSVQTVSNIKHRRTWSGEPRERSPVLPGE